MQLGAWLRHEYSPVPLRLLLAWGSNSSFKTALVWSPEEGYRVIDLMHYRVNRKPNAESLQLRDELMTPECLSGVQHLRWLYGTHLSFTPMASWSYGPAKPRNWASCTDPMLRFPILRGSRMKRCAVNTLTWWLDEDLKTFPIQRCVY